MPAPQFHNLIYRLLKDFKVYNSSSIHFFRNTSAGKEKSIFALKSITKILFKNNLSVLQQSVGFGGAYNCSSVSPGIRAPTSQEACVFLIIPMVELAMSFDGVPVLHSLILWAAPPTKQPGIGQGLISDILDWSQSVSLLPLILTKGLAKLAHTKLTYRTGMKIWCNIVLLANLLVALTEKPESSFSAYFWLEFLVSQSETGRFQWFKHLMRPKDGEKMIIWQVRN